MKWPFLYALSFKRWSNVFLCFSIISLYQKKIFLQLTIFIQSFCNATTYLHTLITTKHCYPTSSNPHINENLSGARRNTGINTFPSRYFSMPVYECWVPLASTVCLFWPVIHFLKKIYHCFWGHRGRVISQSFYCWPSRSSRRWTITFWRVFFLSLGSLLCSLLHTLRSVYSSLASFTDHFPTPFP